jgi:hypothetical protein
MPAVTPLQAAGGAGGGDASAANQTTEISRLTARFGGGKNALVTTVVNSGDTTILTPTSGKALTVYWISAVVDPDQTSTPLIKIKLGTVEIYRVYVLAHWEPFTGAVNDTLVVNLQTASEVAVTVHWTEN